MDRVSTKDGTRAPARLAITAGEPPRRGRPRNAELRAAILQAATDLALAGGTGAVSIDAIAKRAAVSRTTIYKWWPSAAAIVLDGLLASMRESIVPPTGSGTRGALDHQVRALNGILADPTTGPLFRRVIAAAGSNGEVATALLDQWLLPRRRRTAGRCRRRGHCRRAALPGVLPSGVLDAAARRGRTDPADRDRLARVRAPRLRRLSVAPGRRRRRAVDRRGAPAGDGLPPLFTARGSVGRP